MEEIMKQLLTLAVGLVLTGCAAIPGAAPQAPSPVVVVETVLVTVIPTQQPTLVPTQTLAPSLTPQVIVVTATGAAPALAGTTSAPTATAPSGASAPASEATAPFPDNPGGGVFTNLTRSGDKFSLRCQPDVLSLGVSTSNPSVTGVDVWYRIQDRLSVSISNWAYGGSLESDKQGNFTIAFPASRVDQDIRSHRAWFDYQFVAVNKVGDVVGRSAKLAKQVIYTIDCDD
jgi:hypothetical protein